MKKLLFLIIVLSVFQLRSQRDSLTLTFPAMLDELKDLQYRVFKSKKETERLAANREFIKAIEAIAQHSAALTFPFDSLKDISTLAPKDKHFKLLTWNIPRDDESHLYFGFLMIDHLKRVKKGFLSHETIHAYEYFKLVDKSMGIKNPETFVGAPANWFGMLYYDIIECDGFYTLLAWDGNDKLVQRKFIDVLYFKSDGDPVFGKDVFKFPKKNPKRLMFEYSSEVTMSLKYNRKSGRIIYSHLAPREEGHVLDGLYQYYGPDGSFDSMVQKKGKWIADEDVDARNEKNKNDKADKPDPKKQTPVYKPN